MNRKDNKVESIPEGVHPDIAGLCMSLANENQAGDEMTLATGLYKALAAKYREECLTDVMAEFGVGTREELLRAVHVFLEWWKENQPEVQPDERLEDTASADKRSTRAEIAHSSINDTTLFVIDNVVKRTRVTDRYDVMEHMCDVLERRFGSGTKLEENLAKMHLATTKDVLNAIDIYFVMKDLYPDTIFGRARMQAVWTPVFQECFPQEEVC